MACVVALAVYYPSYYFGFQRNRGLPASFAENDIGILVGEIPGDEHRRQQQTYAQEILALIQKESDLAGKVKVRLLQRALGVDREHEEAMEIGQRLRAAFVLRAIPIEGGHRVWLSIMERSSFTTAEASLGRISSGQLTELEKLELPRNVALLARCVLAVSLYHNESYREAEAHLERILEEDELAPGSPPRVDLTRFLGGSRYYLGAYREAVAVFRVALALLPEDAGGLNNLAQSLTAAGEYTEAEPLYQRSLAISEKVLGEKHPAVATTLNNMAAL